MKINERIKHLRKNELKMTQQSFSKRIKLSRSNIGNIETGEVSVTDRVVLSICEEFGVNEDWLRNGTEPIFIDKSREEEIAEIMAETLKLDVSINSERIMKALAKLSEKELEALAIIAESLAEKKS